MKKSPKSKAENSAQSSAQSPAQNPTEPSSSQSDTSLTTQLAELTHDLQRTRADFENFRKTTDLQKTQTITATKHATVQKLLPILDDLWLAIATYPEQLSPVEKNLNKSLAEIGLTKIDSNPGTDFNPNYHEATIMDDSTTGTREVIAETLRPGYFYEGVVLRPAMVKVKLV